MIMPTLRESLRPILAITIAAAIVMVLLAPLDATEWANGLRAGFSAESGDAFEEGPGGTLMIVAPLIKITILMGVPALITMGVRRVLGQKGGRK